MTSVLNVDTIAAKNGTSPVTLTKQSAPKAWMRFNGSGTIAVNDSFATSSLTDDGTGRHSYSFTNNFNSTSYIHVAGSGTGSYSSTTLVATRCHANTPTTSQVGCSTFTVAASAAAYDANSISSTNDGDLA